MSVSQHAKLFSMASFAWLTFWIAGLPDYYKQYSDNFMLWFVLLLLPPLTWVVVLTLRRVHQRRRLMVALWMAFYFTVPLVIFDWLYCGVYLGYGSSYLIEFWYLTVYYIIPWLLFPVSAALLNGISLRKSTVERLQEKSMKLICRWLQ
jgi:hypothetical protein